MGESQSRQAAEMNNVEVEKQRQLQVIENEKQKHANQMDKEKLEIEKSKTKAAFEIKKAELLLNFQTDIRKIEADLIKTRMMTQGSLFEKFVDFMRQTLDSNGALIQQRTKLYELAEKSTDESRFNYFSGKADAINVLDAQQLLDTGLQKVKELNLESSQEMKYLSSKLEEVLGNIDQNDFRLAITNN